MQIIKWKKKKKKKSIMVRNEVDLLRFKVLQAQQHDLSSVLEECGSVLLLPFLHPVTVDAEGAAVDEFADSAEGVGISGQHLPSQRASPAVTAVHPDAGQHGDYQHLRGKARTADEDRDFLKAKIYHIDVTHPKCLSGTEEAHILLLVQSEEGMCQGLLSSETDSWVHHQQLGYLSGKTIVHFMVGPHICILN